MSKTPVNTYESKLVSVTPALAEKWLKKNLINRHVRKSWVRYLADQIDLGLFVPTTDAIGFRHDGVLVNGQHRLLAIIESGATLDMLVVTGLSDSAFMLIDRGISRTLADVLKLPTALLADAALCWRLTAGLTSTKRISEVDSRDTAAWWSPAHNAMWSGGTTGAKGFSGAPLRVGFGARWAIQTLPDNRQYVRDQYKAMLASNTETMSHATATLWKRIIQERTAGVISSNAIKIAAVAFYCADPVRANVSPAMKNLDLAVEQLRDVVKAMESAYLASPRGAEHPYTFTKDVIQTRLAPAKSNRKAHIEQEDKQIDGTAHT